MLLQSGLFLIALVIVLTSAQIMIEAASCLATAWKISPLVIGMTVVAFGTSAPELAISIGAVQSGLAPLAVGNVIGSNIANILLIGGIAGLFAALPASRQLIRQEMPVLLAASVLTAFFLADQKLARIEAAIMLFLALAYTIFLLRKSRQSNNHPDESQLSATPDSIQPAKQIAIFLISLIALAAGSKLLVHTASAIAQALGVSDLIIGLTIVAIGTSVPEIAASTIAVLKKQSDLALGNIIGSNFFNLFIVLSIAGLSAPKTIRIPESLLAFDLPIMLVTTFACAVIMFCTLAIKRIDAIVFLLCYAAYLAWLSLDAINQSLLQQMQSIIFLPLVALAGIIVLLRCLAGFRHSYFQNKK